MDHIENQSAALAWTAASLYVPQQFAQITQKSILKVNEQCKKQVVEIDK